MLPLFWPPFESGRFWPSMRRKSHLYAAYDRPPTTMTARTVPTAMRPLSVLDKGGSGGQDADAFGSGMFALRFCLAR